MERVLSYFFGTKQQIWPLLHPLVEQRNTQITASSLLEEANKLDGYRKACEADWSNRKAREGMQYVAWSDQSFAKEVEEMDSTIRCVILDPSADGGMPHTRSPNIVCIPAYFPKEKLPITLRHEKAHIAIHEIPTAYVRRCRYNPDTIYVRWMAWEGRYIPLPLFLREDKPVLRDIQVRWWDRREKRMLTEPPSSYKKRYGEHVSQ